MRSSSVITTLLAVSAQAIASGPKQGTKLTTAGQSLFDFSMSINDARWDDSYKVISFNNNGPWSNRFTSWYIPGLLQRNHGSDKTRAIDAITKLLDSQMNYAYDSAWYGDWKLSPDEPNPTPDSPLYTPSIYNTYDPNWREFIGVQLVQVVEEFESLLPSHLVSRIEKSLEYAAVGAMRRNGTAPDNLVLAYSNPEMMRTLFVGWVGARTNNQTFIDFANDRGTKLHALFTKNGANTLGEYNAPNYYGIDVFALAANIKYGPAKATLTSLAKPILTELWKDIAEHYNPYLGNMAGPYDRAYTRDMPSHNSIVQFFWWGIFGLDKAPHPPMGDLDLNYDASQGAAIALILDAVSPVLDETTSAKLTGSFSGTRTLRKTIYPDLDSDEKRVATSWLSKDVIIGGMEQYEATEHRGKQFTPAIVHWASDPTHKPFPYNGFFSLYPTASTLKAVASANQLTISYPNVTQAGTSSFQFMLSGIPPPWSLAGNVVDGFSKLPCLAVDVSAPGLKREPTKYGSMIYSHYYYNTTYNVPLGFVGTPTITFKFKYTC